MRFSVVPETVLVLVTLVLLAKADEVYRGLDPKEYEGSAISDYGLLGNLWYIISLRVLVRNYAI